MLLFIDFRPGNWIVAGKRFSWASRSRVGVPLPSRVSLARPVLSCPLLYFTLTLAWPFCNRHDIFSHERTCPQSVFPSYMFFLSIMIIWLTDSYNMIDRKYMYEGKTLCRLIFTTCYSYLSSVFLPKLLGIISWNYKENVFWQSLACFVIGGIITVIFIKLLEWQRD